MKLKRLLPVIILLAILAFLIWRFYREQEHLPPGTLFGNGSIEATDTDVSAKITGKIVKLTVEEGDAVKQGQLLALLDAPELGGQVTQAQGALSSSQSTLAELLAGTRPEDIRRAQAQYDAAIRARQQAKAQYDLVTAGTRKEEIQQLRAGVQAAQSTRDNVESDFLRISNLEKEGAVSRQQLDAARAARDNAAAQLEAAQQRLLEAERGSRPEQIRAAKAAVDQAEAQVAAAKAALDLARAGARKEDIAAAKGRVEQSQGALVSAQAQENYTKIFSPVDGQVTLKNVEIGELVTAGLPIVRLVTLDRPWLKVYVPEDKIGQVKLGQKAEIKSDSYPDKTYPGRVIAIDQEAQFTPKNVQTKEERVKQVFGVKIEIENPQHELKPGMPADALIYVGE